GFSAALLPFLQNRDAQAVQRQRVADHFPGSDAYYNYVLTLFGLMPPKRGRLPSRAQIYAGALSDKYILAWSNSLMDNFIMDVQGS
ncbi:glycosyl hydrolase family 8, partial [Salmonella enterica subsp. enterica serovar Montevideo]|nr:glycosyl hydrolase family 8 [Salmonella enterica subsp. enterica serovar Montevideo]